MVISKQDITEKAVTPETQFQREAPTNKSPRPPCLICRITNSIFIERFLFFAYLTEFFWSLHPTPLALTQRARAEAVVSPGRWLSLVAVQNLLH